MTNAIQNLQSAMTRAGYVRPKAGGFPYFAECLRQAGAARNLWYLPSCQSLFVTDAGNVVCQGSPLVSGYADIPRFDESALIRALRADQAGDTTFPEFLEASWQAGVVSYEVDFSARTVSYFGVAGECYVEDYPAVTV